MVLWFAKVLCLAKTLFFFEISIIICRAFSRNLELMLQILGVVITFSAEIF